MCYLLLRQVGQFWTFSFNTERDRCLLKGGQHAGREAALRAIDLVRTLGTGGETCRVRSTARGSYFFTIGALGQPLLASSTHFNSALCMEINRIEFDSKLRAAPLVEELPARPDRWVGSACPPGISTAGAFEPLCAIVSAGAHCWLTVYDDAGRDLISTQAKSLRSTVLMALPELATHGANPTRYTRQAQLDRHAFQLCDTRGIGIASSCLYASAGERDEMLRRCVETIQARGPQTARVPAAA